MQITPNALFDIIPHNEIKKKTTIGAALLTTRRHFCSQMTTRNLCTTECSNCAERIKSAFEGIEKAVEPVGMLVIRLRHEFATVAEAQDETKAQPKDDTKRNSLGLEVERVDLFEDMLAGVE